MRAVIWTDVFQSFAMIGGVLVIMIKVCTFVHLYNVVFSFMLRIAFYPRDAMLARSLRQRRVCPSVRPSGRLSHAGIVPSRAKARS